MLPVAVEQPQVLSIDTYSMLAPCSPSHNLTLLIAAAVFLTQEQEL